MISINICFGKRYYRKGRQEEKKGKLRIERGERDQKMIYAGKESEKEKRENEEEMIKGGREREERVEHG